MNGDTLQGEGRDLGGKLKETAGDVTGNGALQVEGIGDQLAGKAQKVAGALRQALSGDAPPIDRARSFARERPFATAVLVGVVGIALLNTLRGRR